MLHIPAQLLYNISYIIKIINSNENTNQVCRIYYANCELSVYCFDYSANNKKKENSDADIAFVVLNARQRIDISL